MAQARSSCNTAISYSRKMQSVGSQKTGRLPSFTSDEYFEEIKTLKKYKEENQAQAEEILALKQEIERLNRSSFKAIKGFFTPRKKSEEHK